MKSFDLVYLMSAMGRQRPLRTLPSQRPLLSAKRPLNKHFQNPKSERPLLR